MRRLFLALTILLATAMPAAAQDGLNPLIPGGNSAPPGQQPKAVVESPLYDFGTALEGKMVRHSFKIKNAGKGYLDISGVKTSCGCTAAAPSKTHLAPGDETDISVGFDTRFQKGHQVRTITALTNDPANPQATMTMQGVVKQQVAATPAQIDFGTLLKGAGADKTVVIDDLVGGAVPFEVTTVSNSNQSIKAALEKRTDGKPGAALKVALLPTMPVGQFDDTVKVMTNRVPLQIDVFGSVTGNLSVEPAQVSFGIVPAGQDSVRILRLTNRNASRAVKVLDVSSSAPTVVASAEPVTPGKQYKITVTLRRGTAEGQLHGSLAIKTDDPEQATVTVPFYAIVGQFKT